MAKRYNSRRAKIHRTYSVADLAKLYGVHRNTVLRWMKRGLTPIEPKRPLLFHGEEVRAFLGYHNPRRHACDAGEIYCLKCRSPKRPAGDEVDYMTRSSTTGVLQGLCPTCLSVLNRIIKHADLDCVCRDLNISHRDRPERIDDSQDLTLNSAFKKGFA
jgi:hypothetical protein